MKKKRRRWRGKPKVDTTYGMPIYRYAERLACLACGKSLDSATKSAVVDEPSRQPRDGDVMICFGCCHIMIFHDGAMCNPTDEEMLEIAGDPDIVQSINARAFFERLRKATAPR